MKKQISRVPRERRKGTYLFTASRLEGKVKRRAIKPKKKKPQEKGGP